MRRSELLGTQPHPVNPEQELLLLCTRTQVSPAIANRICFLAGADLDWELVTRLAVRHVIDPLLFSNLVATCPAALPPRVRDQLHDLFQHNAEQNLLRTAELLRLLDLLDSSRLTAVPYKGPVLAASVYGNLALRKFVDLDILIRPQDLPEATRVLISEGYKPDVRLGARQQSAFVWHRYELLFTHPDDDRIVELQWAITPRYFSAALQIEPLMDRAGRIPLGGTQVRSLAAEDLLIVLCIHGTKHLWERLGWICDISEMIRVYPDLDWDRLSDATRKIGCQRILFLGLRLAVDLLQLVLPREIEQQIDEDVGLTPLVAQVSANLFREPATEPGIFRTAAFHLGARERWRDRILYALRFAATPNLEDWSAVSLPEALSFLYYPLRAGRLAAKYARRGQAVRL